MVRQLESRLINEYLNEFHKEDLQWRRVRLGALPTTDLAMIYGVIRRWADAVVFDGRQVIIIEAKIRPKLDAVGQLLGYRDLFGRTPEFSQYHQRPIKLVYLSAMDDFDTRELASKHDIEFIVYSPSWALDYIKEKFGTGKDEQGLTTK